MRALTQVPSLRLPRVHRELAFLLLTVAACCVPFLGQPFHMDDNFYMDMARHARVDPLFPNDTPYAFGGEYNRDMASHSHPPLQTYFLASLQSLFGEEPGNEWIYHSFFLIYPVLAVFSFYFLSALFVERPLWPSLILAVAPVFQVMSHNLMTDIPSLSLWLAGAASFLWAVETERKGLYAASGVFQFAAIFTSYQAVALTPLLGFYQIRKGRSRTGWVALVAPLLAMAGWLALNYIHYGRFILLGTLDYVRSRDFAGLERLGIKLVALLEYQGWLIIFPIMVVYVLGRGLRGRLSGLYVLAAIYLSQMMVAEYRLVDRSIFVAGVVTGAFMVTRMTLFAKESFFPGKDHSGFETYDGQFVSLWYFGVVAYCLAGFTEGSARYILPLLPPFLLCFFRGLEVAEAAEYRRADRPWFGAAVVASGSLVLSLAWGLVLSRADWEFARIYPPLARDVARVADGLSCYSGGEWGFRYYLRRAGCEQLPMDESQVRGGSLLVTPRLALPYNLPADLSSMSAPFQSLIYEPDTVVRTMDWQTPAGFYSTGWGLIPFSLSSRPLERVEIRQVNYLVERLPWAAIEYGGEIKPWPGYVKIAGRDQLALLVKPGTRIIYPWRMKVPVQLEVSCGLSSPVEGEEELTDYEFEVRQVDDAGAVWAQARTILSPATQPTVREWRSLQLTLRSTTAASDMRLELCYSSQDPRHPTGAFAAVTIKPVDR